MSDLSMILALTVTPALLGIQESIRQSAAKSKREEQRARRCNLVVSTVKSSLRSRDIDEKLVVLSNGRLYIDTEALREATNVNAPSSPKEPHPFTGYYLPYPDTKYEGLVSTIQKDPPVLNWIYADQETYQVKYGVREKAQPNLTGPFDWTKQDRRLTFEGWEGFVAVEEFPGVWALYFDRDDDALKSKVPFGCRVLEIEVSRREIKQPKPEAAASEPATLDQKFEELQKEGVPKSKQDADAVGKEPPNVALNKAMERLSLDPYEIFDAYGNSPTAEKGQAPPGASKAKPGEQYIPLIKKEPMPGLAIELGALRRNKTTGLSKRSSPPTSPSTGTTMSRSAWSSQAGTKARKGAKTVETSATSVYEDGGLRRAKSQSVKSRKAVRRVSPPRPLRPAKPRTMSGVGLTPRGYKKPQVEDEPEPPYVAKWLGSKVSRPEVD